VKFEYNKELAQSSILRPTWIISAYTIMGQKKGVPIKMLIIGEKTISFP